MLLMAAFLSVLRLVNIHAHYDLKKGVIDVVHMIPAIIADYSKARPYNSGANSSIL